MTPELAAQIERHGIERATRLLAEAPSPLVGQVVTSTTGESWQRGKVTHQYGDYVVIDSRWEVHQRNVTPDSTQGEEHVRRNENG